MDRDDREEEGWDIQVEGVWDKEEAWDSQVEGAWDKEEEG